jgi:hypothetical protein
MNRIPPMTETNRQTIYQIIMRWAQPTRHRDPAALVAALRNAGFPIVTWPDVYRENLFGDLIETGSNTHPPTTALARPDGP